MSPAPIYSAEDYARAMSTLLPTGAAWPRDPDTMLMRLMGALAGTYQRSGASAAALVDDINPATTTTLLPEWEATLGLPDECSPLDPSTEERRAAVLSKFIASGGQSIPYFVSVALALGYVVTVDEFAPFRVDRSAVGDALYGPSWSYAWAINAPATTVTEFRVGLSRVGDPLASWGNDVLECRLNQIKPAHTTLIFRYA